MTRILVLSGGGSRGAWVLKNGLTASDGPIATSWPATWRLYVPGDADGAPSGDACVLGQVV